MVWPGRALARPTGREEEGLRGRDKQTAKAWETKPKRKNRSDKNTKNPDCRRRAAGGTASEVPKRTGRPPAAVLPRRLPQVLRGRDRLEADAGSRNGKPQRDTCRSRCPVEIRASR